MPRTRAVLEVMPPPPAPDPCAPGVPLEGGTTQRIVESIVTAIAERRLRPGTKLAEQKIADVFGVSRTVVRQALNQLSRDHLVTLEPARGAFVAMPSAEEARQVFETRRIVEAAMLRRLCARLDEAQLELLRGHLRAERAAIAQHDVPARTRLLAEFHLLLARMLGNDVLAGLLGELLTRSSLIALMYQSAQSAEASHAEHAAIVEALARRDARAAVRLAEDHLFHVERNLRLDPHAPDLAQILGAAATGPRPVRPPRGTAKPVAARRSSERPA